MSQLKKVVDPFGEVNIYPSSGGKTRVVATILMEPHKEGAQTGIALDGSGSMAKLYGVSEGGGILSAIFGTQQETRNEITPVAQKICSYLAKRIDADGGTTCIYWAVGPGGSEIEEVGDLRAEQADRHIFGPPREFGTGTQLLPAVKYFVDRFRDAPWGFYVFITDGELHDLEAVKQYSNRLAHDVAARRRNPLKFVLIGIGPDVNESQMEELDDLDTGTPIDLWDHKLAAEMRVLQEIFAEVVDRNARVADHGKILDPQGRVVRDYSDTGLPGQLEFELPVDADYFTLEVNGHRIHQGLSDRARVPPPEKMQPRPSSPKPAEVLEVLPVSPPATAVKPPASGVKPPPPRQQAPAPPPPIQQKPAGEKEIWDNIDFGNAASPEIDIDFGPSTDEKK
jgi:hypothetical protein